MRGSCKDLCLLAALLALGSAAASAQIGPSRAYPIEAESLSRRSLPPLMNTDQTPRTAIVDVVVGTDGITIETTLVQRSGSGIYDERVRGYWKDRRFVPALDADGRPREDTLRITNNYNFAPGTRSTGMVSNHNYGIEGINQADSVARITRMECNDFLWEYDFMAHLLPKADLSREEIFRVGMAWFIASRHIDDAARGTLITHWKEISLQIVDACRAEPAAKYVEGVFSATLSNRLASETVVPP